jgi:hypothetical protein
MAAASSQDYTGLTISAGAQMLQTVSDQFNALAKKVIDVLQGIINDLNELSLSWVGPSQKAADTFNNEWQTMVTTLFGTQKHPEKGVVNKLAMALATAAANYAAVEYATMTACWQFMTAIDPALGSSNTPSSNTPQSVVNSSGQTITALTEQFP